MRLDKLLCQEGLGTRAQVQKAIRQGRALVNGGVEKDPARHVEMEKDAIVFDGQPLSIKTHHYIMLNKPAGILTAARDKKAKTVMDLLPPMYTARGCMPVGRLDKDTTGLLLFTTDGELSHRLLSPKRHVEKTYIALVDGPLGKEDENAFLQGIPLKDFTCLPACLQVLNAGEEKSLARVTIREGKFHQIKRMFLAVGREVIHLHREDFGPLQLDENALPPGQHRPLTGDEVAALYKSAGMEQ